MRRPGGGNSGRGMGPMIPEVDEEDFEDLQLYPFDEPTDEDVLWMAQLLGIHPIRDKQLLYLAEEALINPPTQEWMIFKDIAGNVIWINDVTEEMEPHPPHLEELIENVQRQKRRLQEQGARGNSQDKTSAMKKLLGRHLPSHELTGGPEDSLSGSRTANSNTSLPLGGILGNKYAPLPPKTTAGAAPIQQSSPKPIQQQPKGAADPPKAVGGKMNLMKALEASKQLQGPDTTSASATQDAKSTAGAKNNARQTSASTAATTSKPSSGVSQAKNHSRGRPVADDSGEEFDMDEYKEELAQEEQEDEDEQEDEEDQDEGDSVFDKPVGGRAVQDHDDDGDEQSNNDARHQSESEDEDRRQYGEQGVLGEGDEADIPEEEDQSEELECKPQRQAAKGPGGSGVGGKPAQRPGSAAQQPQQRGEERQKVPASGQSTEKAKQKGKAAQPSKASAKNASEDQNSLLLSQLLSDFQQIQQKVSKLEQDNQDLKQRNEKLEKLQSSQSNMTLNAPLSSAIPAGATAALEEHNIKSGIAEIKKLLEQSILIQNNGKEHADQQRSTETKQFEENRSMLQSTLPDGLRATGQPNFDQTMSAQNYTLSAAFPVSMHQQLGQTHTNRNIGVPQLSNYSMVNIHEVDAKWSSLISRERDRLQSAKLTLQNEKLNLENRKLTLKKHEFEMRKEMQGIKLEDGHPLASKIRENIFQQKSIYKNGVCIWRERCTRHMMKQKSLNLLEKSYLFAKSSGSSWEAADKHLEELYTVYCQADEETTTEIKDHPDDELLSEDSQGMGLDSESDRMFDETNSKSDKVSSTDMGPHHHRIAFEEPAKYKYNLEEIRRSINQPYGQSGSSWFGASSQSPGLNSIINSREGIRSYFQQNSRFYTSMRKEVRFG